jgi:hypothetical protein
MSNFALRVPDSLFNVAKQIAKEDNTSLNQLIVSSLAEKIGSLKTETYLKQRANQANQNDYERVLKKIKDKNNSIMADDDIL